MTLESCWVYVITNKNNGNFYIGISKNPSRPWKDHKQSAKSGESSRLYNTVRKHGKEAAARTPEEQADINAKFSESNRTRVLSEDAERRVAEGSHKGGLVSGPLVREWYNSLTGEEKDARMANIVKGIREAASKRTPEQTAEITAKRMATRARNKALREAAAKEPV